MQQCGLTGSNIQWNVPKSLFTWINPESSNEMKGNWQKSMTRKPECPACFYFLPSSELREVKPRNVLMFIDWLTKEWIEYYLDLFERLIRCGHRVEIVDISAFTFPQQASSFTRSIHRDKAPQITVARELKPRWYGRFPKDESGIQLKDSVESHSASKFNGRTNLVSESIDAFVLRKLSTNLYSQLGELDSSETIWTFQNGRLPHQQALLQYCKHNGVEKLILESNLYWKSHYWARPYPTQDLESLQGEVRSRMHHVNSTQRNLANKWFSEHASPKSKINIFTRRFQKPIRKASIPHQNLAPKSAAIFTSSSDEVVGLGAYWPWTGWSSQYESFSRVSRILRDMGYSITLRIHPNLQNKSLKAMREEYLHLKRFVKDFHVTVIGPSSSANSYELVDAAEIVVVSGSTIGLEALQRGKKVIVTEHSSYDQLPGVLKINAQSDEKSIVHFLEEPFSIGKPSATDWAAVQMSLGWSVQERPGILKNDSLFGKLKYYLNWKTIAAYATLKLSRLLENLPRKMLVRKISKLMQL